MPLSKPIKTDFKLFTIVKYNYDDRLVKFERVTPDNDSLFSFL